MHQNVAIILQQLFYGKLSFVALVPGLVCSNSFTRYLVDGQFFTMICLYNFATAICLTKQGNKNKAGDEKDIQNVLSQRHFAAASSLDASDGNTERGRPCDQILEWKAAKLFTMVAQKSSQSKFLHKKIFDWK